MATSDLIAGYAAILATFLAILKVRDHFAARRCVYVQLSHLIELPTTNLELVVTNLTSFEIELDHVWVGYAYRPWLKPWKRKMIEGHGVIFYEIDGVESVGVDSKLLPGQRVFAYLNVGINFRKRDRILSRDGFDHRLIASVSHSASPYDFVKALS